MEFNLMIVLPVLLPLLTGAVALIAWKSTFAQKLIGVGGTILQLIAAIWLFIEVWHNGVIAVQMGDWMAPFGITLVADLLSAAMVLISGIMGVAVCVYSLGEVDEQREKFGYYPLFHILLMGVNGTFITGDLFNMYVWFEVMLISSFALLSLGNRREQLDGAVKYVVINLFSSALFLAAIGILYGITGTLNMADLAVKVGQVENTGLVTAVSILFMISFGIKAAVFPLFFWLPASYHTPPIAVSAIFAGLLTKVGVYVLIRVFTLIFVGDTAYTHTILLWVAALTMITGVLGAAAQMEVRKILSFHIISQIGYMIMGLALYTPIALVGSVFYIVHHIIVKTNLFLIAGVAQRLVGSYDLKKMGGLYRHYPWLGVLFLIPAFSLAGFPPLSGFWAKFVLIYSAVEISSWAITAVALVVGLLTLFSMTKIWANAFWAPLPEGHSADTADFRKRISASHLFLLVAPIVVLAILTLTIGLNPQPFYEFSLRAAEQLLSRTEYIEAVLKP